MDDTITLRRLGPADLNLLLNVDEGLFDNPIKGDQAEAFLADPLHEMIVALAGEKVVGMASGQILLHPDKAPAFFVNEVGVRDEYQRRGIARRLCSQLIELAKQRNCVGVWVATEGDNRPARGLYKALEARETTDVVVYDWDDPSLDP